MRIRDALIALALGAVAITAGAQPVFQGKTIEIAKPPAHPATPRGDLMTRSVVTLHFQDAPLREVLTALASQIDAGVSIQATNDGYAAVPSLDWIESSRVTVNVASASYWDALAALVKAMPVPLDPQARPGELVLVEHAGNGAEGGLVAREGFLAMMGVPGARRVGALLLAPMAMETGYRDEPGKRLLVRVAVEPRVTGTSGLAVLRLDKLADSTGHSLLGDRHEFVTDEDHGSGDDWARWIFDLGPAQEGEMAVKTMRGDLRFAVGDRAQGTFNLAAMFTPTPAVPGEVQVNEECQVFHAPDFAVARGTYVSRDREFPDICKVVNAHHRIPGLDGEPQRANVSYMEERTLKMHNATGEPETFVVWTTFSPDEAHYTSMRKPVKVLDHGEYRVTVAPGATERLHVAYEVDQRKKQPPRTVVDVPLAPRNLWQQTTVGEVRLAVKAVVPTAGEYVLRGEFSSRADGPVKYACPRNCQVLDVRDANDRQIPRAAAFGPIQRVGGRDVMEWSLTTEGRGLVPATLKWAIEGETRWADVRLGK